MVQRLPPIISRKLVEKEAKQVKLITKEGISVVTIQKLQDGRLWFTNGWHAFVLKNGLVAGEFITFKHTGSSIFQVKVPRFFKVLFPGCDVCLVFSLFSLFFILFLSKYSYSESLFCGKYLNVQRLPPIMPLKLDEKEAKKAMLITKKGTSVVTIQKSQDGELWFTNGWHAFVLKHGLVAGDFITLKHMGSSNFKVTVYSDTCCEKDFIDEPETEDTADTGANNATPSVKSEAEEVPPPPPTQHHFRMNDSSDARKGLYGREEDDQKIDSAKLNPINKEHFELSDVKVERDEDIITSQLNSRPAPLLQILVEMDNDNFRSQDGEKGPSPNTTRAGNSVKSCFAKFKRESNVKKVVVKRKYVRKVKTLSPTQNLQFSSRMKSYHLRHRSPYMVSF
ncbi:unnamed protein product [Cuscuta europaea]|uniref:TF-B3 domain-containing protein n=1 Tax=Cuscuta europaea TaxID=41803 RepID=A0A9P0YGX2_CUSEU|nr:unnamed protein product [Cuscuta europaea]